MEEPINFLRAGKECSVSYEALPFPSRSKNNGCGVQKPCCTLILEVVTSAHSISDL